MLSYKPAARASEEHVPEHTAQGAWSRSVGLGGVISCIYGRDALAAWWITLKMNGKNKIMKAGHIWTLTAVISR